MPTSATGIRRARPEPRRSTRGFSLLELLVVVAIVALLATLTSLSIASLDARRVEREAERLAALLRLAQDEAVLGGRDLGLRVSDGAIAFVAWHLDPESRAIVWEPVSDDGALRPRDIEPDLELRFPAAPRGARDAAAPQVLLPATGDLEPFTLEVRVRADPRLVSTVSAGPDGTLTVAHGSP